jgi:predicted dehydrogenase
MNSLTARRDFLKQSSAAALVAASFHASTQPSHAEDTTDARRVVVGVMGLSRGRALAQSFARQTNVEVRYLCDADKQRVAAAQEVVRETASAEAQGITDFRKMLDDPELDVLVCAAPNHWHAPATILACQAGKHVYVEKPCSHNPWEGEAMVRVAREHNKVVQLGTQRRSSPGTQRAMQLLHEGAIGRVYLSRAYYNSARGSIGHGKQAAVPEHLDYELWQGPAPRVPYTDNVVHYNWHWRWHWGNGELGNNGVHTLDLCRWGLNVTYPTRVVSSGGRYAYQDDQETPDTHTVAFEFPENCAITWQGLSCNRHGSSFVEFYGTDGALELESNGNFRVFDRRDGLQEEYQQSNLGDVEHIANFLAAVRQGDPSILHAEILEGHRSTLLCHLGNISQRVGRALDCDPENGHIQGDEVASSFWKRDYESGWEPQV